MKKKINMTQRIYYSRDGNGLFDRILGHDALASYVTILRYIMNNMKNSICGKIRHHWSFWNWKKWASLTNCSSDFHWSIGQGIFIDQLAKWASLANWSNELFWPIGQVSFIGQLVKWSLTRTNDSMAHIGNVLNLNIEIIFLPISCPKSVPLAYHFLGSL